MPSLYEINAQILETLDLDTGEILDTAAFDQLQMARDEKIENIALWIKNLRSEAESLKAEAKTFTERQKRADNKAESLTKYLDSVLNGQKFKSVKAEVSYRKSSSVDITDIDKVPEAYKTTKTEVSADKKAIGAAIKALAEGETFEGAVVVEKQNIQVK